MCRLLHTKPSSLNVSNPRKRNPFISQAEVRSWNFQTSSSCSSFLFAGYLQFTAFSRQNSLTSRLRGRWKRGLGSGVKLMGAGLVSDSKLVAASTPTFLTLTIFTFPLQAFPGFFFGCFLMAQLWPMVKMSTQEYFNWSYETLTDFSGYLSLMCWYAASTHLNTDVHQFKQT